MPEENNHFKPRFHLRDLINTKEWQAIQDNFSLITEVSLRTLDAEGNKFSNPSRIPRICTEAKSTPALKEKVCSCCLPTFLGGNAVVDRNLSYSCFSDLHNVIAPLRVNGGQVLGYIILGPVILVMRKAKEDYLQAAEELGMDLEEYWGMLLEIRTISFNGVRSLVELVKDVAEYILRVAYQNLNKEEATGGVSLDLNRIFNVLLEVAFQVTGADIGSIMFTEAEGSELTIRSSRGIPEEITRTTRVSPGEGISGIAVKERKSFLLNEEISDSRILPYLKRPYIKSSMVVPIVVKGESAGVINLGTLRESSVRFGRDNLRVLQKLVDLASLAITP